MVRTLTSPNQHEKTRLKTLRQYGILDTEPEAAYDDLTRLAATLCQAPIAAVALVDAERIWFKSVSGIIAREMRRDACPPALALGRVEARPVHLEDTWRNGWRGAPPDACGPPRASGNHGDSWPDEVRFLAGAPLVSRDKQPLGSLIVMDTVPRSLSAAQRDSLDTLARQVMAHLELRRNARDLADTVAELREAEKTIRYMAFHDALTGLPSRALFHDRLCQALKAARRCDQAVSVMFLDLDGFKAVNDTWGHATGDRLLVSVAARLSGALRKNDTVARIGGDEFALICTGIRDEEEAGAIARKLLGTFQNPLPVDGLGLRITASIGIALYPMDGATPESLLLDADTAMYRAKRHGKNTFAFSAIASRKSCEHVP